jgi:nucleoside-diphosphate kinase
MEKTLILLKPDCLSKGACGQVLTRFEQAGFAVRGMKMMQLTPEVLREHYSHVADKPFYPDIENFMKSTPVIAVVLEGEEVINKVRDMLGVTNSKEAAAGTIRADFGEDMMVNVVHASDGPETAAAEVARFFNENELFNWNPIDVNDWTGR